jgi:hypothetical protein
VVRLAKLYADPAASPWDVMVSAALSFNVGFVDIVDDLWYG